MRRSVLVTGLAVLAAVVLPGPALADGRVVTDRSPVAEASAATPNFNLGGVPCSLIPVPAAEDPAPVASGTCSGVRPGARVLSLDRGLHDELLVPGP